MDRADKIIYRLVLVVIWLVAPLGLTIFFIIDFHPSLGLNYLSSHLFDAGVRSLPPAAVVHLLLWRWIHKRETSNQYEGPIRLLWFILVWLLLLWTDAALIVGLLDVFDNTSGRAGLLVFFIPAMCVLMLGYGAICKRVLNWVARTQPKYFWGTWSATIVIAIAMSCGTYLLAVPIIWVNDCAPSVCL